MIKFVTQKINSEFAIEKLGRKYPVLYSGQDVNQEKVKTFSRLMKQGLWIGLEHDSPISFNEEGELMNGQHRLLAIIDSGVEIEETIAYDVPKAIIATHGDDSKDGVDEFVWGCAEFILDFIGVKTRNNSLIRKVYANIYERLSIYVPHISSANRLDYALFVSIICAEESAISKKEISEKLMIMKINSKIPEEFFLKSYAFIVGIKGEIVRPPIHNFLPSEIYEAVIRNG